MKRLTAVSILLLCFSLSSWGQSSDTSGETVTILETTWNGLNLNYALLVKHNSRLDSSLRNLQFTNSKLIVSQAKQWLDLNSIRNLLSMSQSALRTAETQLAISQSLLQKSDDSLQKAIDSYNLELRKAKIEGILWGVGGTVVLGLLTWGTVELIRYIRGN